MLQKLRLLILALSIIFIFGCLNNSIDKNVQQVIIDDSSYEKMVNISDKIEEVKIIKLEESPGNYIGDVFKLFYLNDNLIAFDRFNTHKINSYDSNGVFNKNIVKTGEGPDDMFQINDCWLNYKTELEAYDFAAKKIFQFDKSFNLKNVIKANESLIFKALMRIPNSDNYVGYAAFNEYNPAKNGEYYHIAFLDKNLSISNTALEFNKKYLGIEWLSFRQHFYSTPTNLLFGQAYDNYIYNVLPSRLERKYKIVYKKFPLPEDIFEDIVSEHLQKFKNRLLSPDQKSKYFKEYSTFSGTWLESDGYIFLTSTKGNEHFISLVDKKNDANTITGLGFSESKKYKMIFPYFTDYDNSTKSYLCTVDGKSLNACLGKDSKFRNELKIVPEDIYVVKVKFK